MPPNNRKLLDDCFLHDKDRLRHDEALAILKKNLSPIAQTEKKALADAHDFYLAAAITAPTNIPSTDNSAVDGYAYAGADYKATGGYFPVTVRIAAGEISAIELAKDSVAQIFTGAVVPHGVDTIAMQEDCEIHTQDGMKFVAIPPGLKKGANLRKAGEDVLAGDEIATVGSILTPALMAAIASTGTAQISVYSPLKIGLISSGNELLRPGTPALAGQVYDSNHYLLAGLLSNLPVAIKDYGVLPDDYEAIEKTLAKAAGECDVVISSGGASRGEEDHVISALDAIGKRHLWQIAVKPGRPMSFGQIGDTPVFGLPGNPVACFVCFLLYVRQALILLGGGNWQQPQRFLVPSGFAIKNKKSGRREFWRGNQEIDKKGNPVLKKFDRDGSGLITGLRTSGGLIEVPEEVTEVKVGDLLRFIPFSNFGRF